jgi:hypothetical protein
MNEGSGILTFWILIPIFLFVGLYLIWYSRRRKKILEAFADTHLFRVRSDHKEKLQKTLDSCFTLEAKGLVRSFGQLSSIVEADPTWLFRAVELLDLNPHAQSQSAHFSRIVALFDISVKHNEFFILDRSTQPKQRLPGSTLTDRNITEITKQIAKSCSARHPLSVTLARGHGLIYFEPLMTGGETLSDVNSLYCIAKKMCEKLSGNI